MSDQTPPTDFFSTLGKSPAAQQTMAGDIRNIPLEELHEFKGHVFPVYEDTDMDALAAGIKANGQLEPALVRPRPDGGGYEIISGHRRCHACKLAGVPTLRCIVTNLDDDAAEEAMMDANKHRSWIAPSVKAEIYRREMELYDRRQGRRTDLQTTSATGLPKLRWRDQVGQRWGISGETVRQMVSLLRLPLCLLSAVDCASKAATGAAVETNALQITQKAGVQLAVLDDDCLYIISNFFTDNNISRVNAAQAAAIVKCSREESLTGEMLKEIFGIGNREKTIKTTSFSVPSAALDGRLKQYRKDSNLQQLIIETINRYVAEKECETK